MPFRVLKLKIEDVYNMTGYTFLSKPRTNKRGGEGGWNVRFKWVKLQTEG